MQFLGPEVLTALTLKGTVFCVLILCSSDTARRFGERYCLHLQGLRISHAKSRRNKDQVEPTLLVSSSTLKIGIMFLRNVGLSPNHTTLQPKIPYPSRFSSFGKVYNNSSIIFRPNDYVQPEFCVATDGLTDWYAVAQCEILLWLRPLCFSAFSHSFLLVRFK
jgi:hypothetical protein